MARSKFKPIALVSMPTASANSPCFQLGLLKPTLESAGFDVEVLSLYMYFGSFVGWPLHEEIARVYPSLIGEWIWAKHAFGDFADDDAYIETFKDSIENICKLAQCNVDDIRRVRDEATGQFLDFCLDSVDWSVFGLVGFTVLFQQQLASLAFARILKERYPELPVIFGGGSLEDDIATEIMRNCPQVDFIHCGDADKTFPEFVRRLYSQESMADMPGILWRDSDHIAYWGRAHNLIDMESTPAPDFDEYFQARQSGGYAQYMPDQGVLIPFESSRGCWWGQKSHCTFCGLNRAGLEFRSKSVDNTIAMLDELASRYGVLGFNAMDNILDPLYVETLFSKLAMKRVDFRIHYPVRANLTRHQLAVMRLGGVYSVQPGIESLSTNVLRCMKKGITAIRNLEFMKWCSYYGIESLYHLLVGFPGETATDYLQQADLISKIPHFEPPISVGKARPDRGSPMFTSPESYSISSLMPEACYQFLYPQDSFDLSRVSYYFFPVKTLTLTDQEYEPLFSAVDQWRTRWVQTPPPFLSYSKSLTKLIVTDGRWAGPVQFRYSGRDAKLYEFCDHARSLLDIESHFKGPAPWINRRLEEWISSDLMVLMDGRYLGLATPEYRYHDLDMFSD